MDDIAKDGDSGAGGSDAVTLQMRDAPDADTRDKLDQGTSKTELFTSASTLQPVSETVDKVGTVAKKSATFAIKGAVKGVQFMTRNGQICHATPVAPYSDVAELEYVSSLHQCSNMQELKEDGSVSAQEISTFLKSRHGLNLSTETVRNVVLGGLTADKVENDVVSENDAQEDEQATMDLVELTSTLIIPNLLRLRRKRSEQRRELVDLRDSESHCPQCRHLEVPSKVDDKVPAEQDGKANDPGTELFKDVLSLILVDVTGSADPKPIGEKLVRDILLCYGEEHLARDEQLVAEMVACATGSTNVLDTDAFVEGLTSDVERKYDPRREVRISTNFQDVFGYAEESKCGNQRTITGDEEFGRSHIAHDLLREETFGEKCIKILRRMKGKCCRRGREAKSSGSKTALRNEQNDSDKDMYERMFVASSIDYAADNYRTRVHGVIAWIAFVAFYVVYLLFGATTTYESNACDESNKNFLSTVACPFVSGVVNALLVVVELILFGTPFICLASIGNDIEGRESAWQMIVGILSFLLFVFIPYAVRMEVPYWFSTNGDSRFRIISLVCGLLVTVLQMVHLGMIWMRSRPGYQKWFTWYYSLGNVSYESKIKKSGLFKTDQMLASAIELHRESLELACGCGGIKSKRVRSQKLTNYGRALFEYSKLDGIMVEIGGIWITWRKIWDGTLFTEDGIWLSNRLVLGTVFQIGVCCATPYIAVIGMDRVIEYLVQRENYEVKDENLAKAVIALGATAGFFTAVGMTIVFLPTMVSTTLKFRRGVIPSLRSWSFLRYRFALDQVTLMYGGMFWGVLVSAAAVAVIVGSFVFLIAWERTSEFILSLIGNYLGLGLVIVTKIIILQLLRNKFFSAFYRKSPLAANLVTIAMECYSAAISVYFMLVRAAKILVLGAMYIGRIDTPLFADGVGMFGPIEVDNWPTVSRKEILIHESHRHPYLETLGYLYLMQLRYKDGEFATRSCSAWRLVFVSALMPWLHKFRELARPEDFGQDHDRMKFRNFDRRSGLMTDSMRSNLMLHKASSRNISRLSMSKIRLVDFEEDDAAERKERVLEIKEELKLLEDELRELEEEE